MKAININWNVDDVSLSVERKNEILSKLPKEVEIPFYLSRSIFDDDGDFYTAIANWLSDKYGFLIDAYELENSCTITCDGKKIELTTKSQLKVTFTSEKGIVVTFSNGSQMNMSTLSANELFNLGIKLLDVANNDNYLMQYLGIINDLQLCLDMSSKYHITINEYCKIRQLVYSNDFRIIRNKVDCSLYYFMEYAKHFEIDDKQAVHLFNNINQYIDFDAIYEEMNRCGNIIKISDNVTIATFSAKNKRYV